MADSCDPKISFRKSLVNEKGLADSYYSFTSKTINNIYIVFVYIGNSEVFVSANMDQATLT